MKPGMVILRGESTSGRKFLLRYPHPTDAPHMTEYINSLSEEKTFITFQGETISLDTEEKYLTDLLSKISSKKAVTLFAVSDDKIIGISDVILQPRTSSHEGVLGLSIAKDYRGEKIGGLLLDAILQEAETELPELKIITLGVFANNSLAIRLYENRGFKVSGLVPKGIYYKGNYVDHVYMYKIVKEF